MHEDIGSVGALREILPGAGQSGEAIGAGALDANISGTRRAGRADRGLSAPRIDRRRAQERVHAVPCDLLRQDASQAAVGPQQGLPSIPKLFQKPLQSMPKTAREFAFR
jgi:hypothetical protein